MGHHHHHHYKEPPFIANWWFGLCCVLLAGLTACIFNVSVKRVTSPEADDPLPAVFILLIRQWVIFFTNVPVACYTNAPILEFGHKNRNIWTLLTLRSISALLSIFCALQAVQRISLPDFATIKATEPVITLLISWPLLGQRPKVTDIVLFLACLTGVTFVVRPDFIFDGTPTDLPGSLFAVIAVLMQSLMFVSYSCLRHIPVSSVSTIYGFFSGWVTVVFVVTVYFRWPPCSTMTRVETIFDGLLSSARITLNMLASRSLPASFLALDPVSELFYQFLWQIFAKGIIPHTYSIIGACIVVVVFIFLVIRTLILQRVDKSLFLVRIFQM